MSEKAIVYAAKSTEDVHGSIPTQLDDCRAIAEREGLEVVGEYSDEAFSAYRGNRGPGLERAMAEAERLGAALIVQHSDRLARGDGARSRHLVELVLWARKAKVTLRSVHDPQTFDGMGLVYAALMGDRNHEDSARKSKAVTDGKRRQLEKGDHLGGPMPDGYVIERQHDQHCKVSGRTFRRDPKRAELVERMFEMSLDGVGDPTIARRLNSEGARTRVQITKTGKRIGGRPYDRRAVQNVLTNAFYAGRVAYKRGTPDERVVDAHHEPLVDPAAFQELRQERDLGAGRHVTGRPVQNHALAKLAVCGRCGERMYARTSSYRRKDGGRHRFYACHGYAFSTGTCGVKVDAEPVDRAVIAGLDSLLLDFEAWRRQIEDRHAGERARLVGEVDRARHDRDDQAKRSESHERKFSEYLVSDEHKADLILPMVERERQALGNVETRLRAAEDALDSIPTEAPADAMLDFAVALQRAVSGRMDQGNNSLAEVNEALRDLFDGFVIQPLYESALDQPDPRPKVPVGLMVQPVLKSAVAHSLDGWRTWHWLDEPAPPLRWLQPEQNVPNLRCTVLFLKGRCRSALGRWKSRNRAPGWATVAFSATRWAARATRNSPASRRASVSTAVGSTLDSGPAPEGRARDAVGPQRSIRTACVKAVPRWVTNDCRETRGRSDGGGERLAPH
jgi:DNA invertase Pin-like site-specific DNA recombinase